MFIRYFVSVDRPFEEVEARFLKNAGRWMPPMALKANGRGARLLSEMGFNVGERRIGRRIRIDLGEPRQTQGVTLVPIAWRADENAIFFPVLNGQLEIAKIGAATTQVGLSASYEPPFGLAGKVVDHALLHRVAEATVKDFMERVGHRLTPRPLPEGITAKRKTTAKRQQASLNPEGAPS